MPRRKWRGIAEVPTPSRGYVYHMQTTRFVRAEVITQKFYEMKDPPWFEQMNVLANPWHRRRRWQVRLGFMLLAVARGERVGFVVTS